MQFGGKRPAQRIQGIYQSRGRRVRPSASCGSPLPLEAAVFTMVGYSWWEKEFKKQGYHHTQGPVQGPARHILQAANNQGRQ
jgi:hypothetical protein